MKSITLGERGQHGSGLANHSVPLSMARTPGLLSVELIQLQCAVAVADELHFSRAAGFLNMDQSAVSRRIIKLESLLGVRLFDRGVRIQLTSAGEAFIRFARPAVENARAAYLIGQAAGRGEPSELIVGYTQMVDTRLIAQMETLVVAAGQARTVRFQSVDAGQLETLLVTGSCHAGITLLPVGPKLTTTCLARERLLAAIPATHRLAREGALAIAELGDEPIIRIAREIAPVAYEGILHLFRRGGYTPNVKREAQSVAEGLGLVCEGLGILFVKESEQRLRAEGLVMRPFTESHMTVDTGLVYLNEIKWECLHDFVALTVGHLRREE